MSKYFENIKYKCPKCGEVFSADEMSANKSYCKNCYREYMRNYMRKRKENKNV